jgi:hypothetical protein
LDDDAPRYYHDNVVNVIKRAAKVKRIDPKEAAKRKTTFLQSMQNINANLKRSMTLEGTILGGSAPEELISNAVLMKRNADINRKSADEISRGSGESLPDIVDDHPSPRFLGYVYLSNTNTIVYPNKVFQTTKEKLSLLWKRLFVLYVHQHTLTTNADSLITNRLPIVKSLQKWSC